MLLFAIVFLLETYFYTIIIKIIARKTIARKTIEALGLRVDALEEQKVKLVGVLVNTNAGQEKRDFYYCHLRLEPKDKSCNASRNASQRRGPSFKNIN